MNFSQLFSNILAVGGIISMSIGVKAWYEAKVTKSYAAQQDFKELKKMLNQQAEDIKALKRQDEALTELLIDYLPKAGESPSQIMKRLQGKD